MNPIRRPFLTLLLAGTAWLAGCATAPSPLPGLAQADAVLRGADPASAVQLLAQPNPATIGQPVQLLLTSSQAGYLYLYQVDTDGRRIAALFPNAVDGANYTRGGALTLPREHWRLTTRGPAGQGYFVAVLSPEPMDLTMIARETAEGRIPVPARYGAALAALREVAP